VPRVVIAGLGDAGLLTAIRLSGKADVVGISAKPGLVSGQELGMRLARPDEWARDYWVTYDRFRKLDRARVVHGTLSGLDPDARTVSVRAFDGTETTEPYDALVIATGVSNGFWRTPALQTVEQVDAGVRASHGQLAAAASVAVIGGGAAAVSAAYNVAAAWPDKQVELFFPGDRALPQHHDRVWATLQQRLRGLGVGLNPGHRAVVPDGFRGDAITTAPVAWSTGQAEARADAVVWAIGRVQPNTGWLPPELLDDDGFVRVDESLRAVGHDGIYAIGDVAATGPLRNSARGRADGLLVHNVLAGLRGGRLKRFAEAPQRWGSVVGTQDNTLEIFTPTGRTFRIPAWSRWQPLLVRRSIYQGIRND
jgi:NADH dehydrogenase FAD-containing subunit